MMLTTSGAPLGHNRPSLYGSDDVDVLNFAILNHSNKLQLFFRNVASSAALSATGDPGGSKATSGLVLPVVDRNSASE
ncbi:hypothetical protein PROFUN_07709 [Planoprotostelium fungivorum]|uniref:Uncharacterized protein n=1 Tax=Planoprotostelium fungivorum TaxID=1890364 RepID=A0A2P6MM84_9EUKA|nr:hypothetical protein PROFUN_07709 [Planoprotostelium fungivorum]